MTLARVFYNFFDSHPIAFEAIILGGVALALYLTAKANRNASRVNGSPSPIVTGFALAGIAIMVFPMTAAFIFIPINKFGVAQAATLFGVLVSLLAGAWFIHAARMAAKEQS